MNNKKNEDINWEKLAKYISGDCSESEKAEIISWINEDERNQEIYESARKTWNLPEEDFEQSDTQAMWNKIKVETGLSDHEFYENKKTSFFEIIYGAPILKYAAVFIIVISISLIYYFIASEPLSEKYLTINVDMGRQQQVLLPDNSKVTLDAGSWIKYPDTFDKDIRKVEIFGECFFEVEPKEKKSFEVIAENALITVVGTKFNIRTFDSDKSIDVFVAEGKVMLNSSNKEGQKILLTEGYSSSVSESGLVSTPIEDKNKLYISWLEGERYFENTLVTEVLSQIERWYDVEFNYDITKFENDELTIQIHKNSLSEMLELISGLTSLDYKIEGKTITLQ